MSATWMIELNIFPSYEWHIGATSQQVANAFIAFLHAKLG